MLTELQLHFYNLVFVRTSFGRSCMSANLWVDADVCLRGVLIKITNGLLLLLRILTTCIKIRQLIFCCFGEFETSFRYCCCCFCLGYIKNFGYFFARSKRFLYTIYNFYSLFFRSLCSSLYTNDWRTWRIVNRKIIILFLKWKMAQKITLTRHE